MFNLDESIIIFTIRTAYTLTSSAIIHKKRISFEVAFGKSLTKVSRIRKGHVFQLQRPNEKKIEANAIEQPRGESLTPHARINPYPRNAALDPFGRTILIIREAARLLPAIQIHNLVGLINTLGHAEPNYLLCCLRCVDIEFGRVLNIHSFRQRIWIVNGAAQS